MKDEKVIPGSFQGRGHGSAAALKTGTPIESISIQTPHSQTSVNRRHLQHGPDRLVWYAGYGSNLLRARFMAYIAGGSPPGEAFSQVGCTDPTPPHEDRPVTIPNRLYFAQRSRNWENGGVCFIRRRSEPGVETLGRMYLVTEEQFREVFYQENGWNDFREARAAGEAENSLRLDLDRVPPMGAMETAAPGWYSTLLRLGECQGHPIFTFTASWDEDRIPHVPPGPRYRETVVRGIKECYGLPDSEVEAYLEGWSRRT